MMRASAPARSPGARRRGAIGASWFALCLLALALHWRLLAGEALIPWDVTRRMAPWQRPANAWNAMQEDPVVWELPHALHRARHPGAWNPDLALGHPAGLFDLPYRHDLPARALQALLPPWAAKGVASLLYVAAAGIGMLHYLRWRGFGARAALLGAVAWQLAPANMRLLEISTTSALAAWTPFVLWGAEAAATSLSLRHALLGALALAGAAIHGFQTQTSVLLCAVAAAVMLAAGRPYARPARFAAVAATVLVGGLLLAAVRLAPMTAAMAEGSRAAIPWSEYYDRTARLDLRHLLLFVVPDALGSPLREWVLEKSSAQPYMNYFEVLLYVGLPVLVLGLAAVRRGRLALAALALAAVVLAFPTPLGWLLHSFVPGFGISTPTRVLWVLQLVAPVLAAAGARDVLAGSRRPARVALAVGAVTVAAALALTRPAVLAGLVSDTIPPERRAAIAADLARRAVALGAPGLERGDAPAWLPVQPVRGEGRVGLLLSPTLGPLLLASSLAVALMLGRGSPRRRRAGLTAVFGLLALEHLHHGITFNATSRPEALFAGTPGVARALELAGGDRVLSDAGAWPNVLMPFGVRDVCAYGLVLDRSRRLLATVGDSPRSPQLTLPRALPPPWRDALCVRVVLTAPGVAPTDSRGLTLVRDGPDLALWSNPTALPRARLHPLEAAVGVAGPDEALACLAAAGFDPTRHVVVETARGLVPSPSPPAPAPARLVVDEPDRVVIEVDAPRGGVLVLADSWAAGWSAHDDGGAALEIAPVDVALRGVLLPPGFHGRVTWEYRAPGQRLGWALTALGAVAFVAAWRVARPAR